MNIIKTQVSDKAEQFTIGLDHYVGRRVLRCDDDTPITEVVSVGGEMIGMLLFRLDYSKGDIFIDPSLLRPLPDSKIEETSK